MTFCGKDASCYCLKTCILNSAEHKRHKHTCGRRDCGGDSCLILTRLPQPFMLIPAVQTRFAPYFPVLPSLTVNPNENKQPLARRDSRKPFVFTKWIWGEQVCFAGSGCLPLCRLGPGPCAVSGPGGREERRLAATWMHWQPEHAAIHRWPLQLCLHPADVIKPPMW